MKGLNRCETEKIGTITTTAATTTATSASSTARCEYFL